MSGCESCHEQEMKGDLMPGDPGTVTLVYVGSQDTVEVAGPASGRPYRFGLGERVVVMVAADAMALAVRCDLVAAEVRIEKQN